MQGYLAMLSLLKHSLSLELHGKPAASFPGASDLVALLLTSSQPGPAHLLLPPPLQGWVGARVGCARFVRRLRVAFGAVTWRTRHRYLFQRPGSAAGGASAASSFAHAYSRVGSGASAREEGAEEEEVLEGSGQGQPAGPGGLQEVLVGGSGHGQGSGGGVAPAASQSSPREALLSGKRDSIE